MTILQMKYFISVCDNGSLNLASRKLFITQPALSTAIKQLEKEFNIRLFNRNSHGLTLTKEGEYFYEKAKTLLESIDKFRKDLDGFSQQKYTVRIGVPPMIGSFLFPKIHRGFLHDHPEARFEIWEEGSLSIRKMIQNKSLDIGFSILNDAYNEHYQKEVILETELLYCVSKDNKIAKYGKLTVQDILNEPIILMKEGFYQNQLINNLFADFNKNLNIILVSSQLSLIRNFVKANAGGAFLMRELIEKNDDSIVGIPLENPLKLTIGLIWQKDASLHKGAVEFINYLKAHKKDIAI